MEPTIMPPMMPVTMPAVGGIPEASEMPIQRGRATRKTTIEARKSRPKVCDEKGEVMTLCATCVFWLADAPSHFNTTGNSLSPQQRGTIAVEPTRGKTREHGLLPRRH
jgi:hypothetical protein